MARELTTKESLELAAWCVKRVKKSPADKEAMRDEKRKIIAKRKPKP